MTPQQFDDLGMFAAGRPRQRSCPRRIAGQVWFCTPLKEELNHLLLAELRRPAKRGRTNVFVACVQIRAVIEKDGRFLPVVLPGKFMQRADLQPICRVITAQWIG